MNSTHLKELRLFASSFINYRNSTNDALNNYTGALMREFKIKNLQKEVKISKEVAAKKHTSSILKSINTYLAGSLNVGERLRLLQKMLQNKEPVLVLVISSDRLVKTGHHLNIKNYLSQLSIGFNADEAPDFLSKKITDAKNTILFDVNDKSMIKDYKNLYEKEGVLLFDQNFIRSLAINNGFKSGVYIFKYYKHLLKNHKQINEPALEQIIKLYCALFDKLYKAFESISVYFYTSNSLSIEILRYYFMCQSKCDEICEIMHGIPSQLVQNYFIDTIELNRRIGIVQNYFFITQIPQIREAVMLSEKSSVFKNTSINAQINSYFIKNKVNKKNKSQIFRFISKTKQFEFLINSKKPYFVFLFVGGAITMKGYKNSDSFILEKKMINTVLDYFKAQGTTIKILYALHPFNRNEKDLFYDPIFQNKNIEIIHDILLGLFLANATTGIISSALFEATVFEIPSFIPMKHKEKIFTFEVLNLLNFPKDNQDVNGSFIRFLNSLNPKKAPLQQQIKTKINKL